MIVTRIIDLMIAKDVLRNADNVMSIIEVLMLVKKSITYWFNIKIRSFYVHQVHNGIFRPSTVHLNPQWTLEIEILEACITIIGQRPILECHPILDVRHLHQDLNTDHVIQTHQ